MSSNSSIDLSPVESEASDFGAEREDNANIDLEARQFGPYMFEPPLEPSQAGLVPGNDEALDWRRLDHTRLREW